MVPDGGYGRVVYKVVFMISMVTDGTVYCAMVSSCLTSSELSNAALVLQLSLVLFNQE